MVVTTDRAVLFLYLMLKDKGITFFEKILSQVEEAIPVAGMECGLSSDMLGSLAIEMALRLRAFDTPVFIGQIPKEG